MPGYSIHCIAVFCELHGVSVDVVPHLGAAKLGEGVRNFFGFGLHEDEGLVGIECGDASCGARTEALLPRSAGFTVLGSAGFEHCDQHIAFIFKRNGEGRHTFVVFGFEICTRVDQQLGHIDGPCVDGAVQGAPQLLVAHVHVGTGVQKGFDRVWRAELGSNPEGRTVVF